jgi:hypothetical protein
MIRGSDLFYFAPQLAAAEVSPAYAAAPASPTSSRKRHSKAALTGGKVVGSDEASGLSVPAGCKLTDPWHPL